MQHPVEAIYLDHAASSPQRPEVTEAMARVAGLPGNPSATHAFGRRVRALVEEAREEVAELLGAEPAELLFTAGGTEADNLAVIGGYRALPRGAGVVTTRTEHAAVTEAVGRLVQAEGAELGWAEVDAGGLVPPAALAGVLDAWGSGGGAGPDAGTRPALVSIVWGNSETGVLQDVPALAEVVRARGGVLHVDAVQVVGHAPVDVAASGVHLLSMAAHKVGGPQGVGLLVARRGVGLRPVNHGGGQERRIRSGTVPVALVVGLAAALRAALADGAAEQARLRGLQERFEAQLAAVAAARVTGAGSPRLPHVSHVTFAGCRSQDLLFLLDDAGVAASGGSACAAGTSQPSATLAAMGRDADEAASGIRFSWGWSTTVEEVDRAAAALPGVVERARVAGQV